MSKKPERSQHLQGPPPVAVGPFEASARFTAATGSNHELTQRHLIEGVLAATRISQDPEEITRQIDVSIALLEGIKPEGELEGMLAAQMVATHMAAMGCLKSAAENNKPEFKDMYLRHAERLLATYTRQLEAFDKHRGKGPQNVTVGHLHVQQGGNSLVGNVQVNSGTPISDNGLNIDQDGVETTGNADTRRRKRSPRLARN